MTSTTSSFSVKFVTFFFFFFFRNIPFVPPFLQRIGHGEFSRDEKKNGGEKRSTHLHQETDIRENIDVPLERAYSPNIDFDPDRGRVEDRWRAVERESEENSRFVIGFQGQPAIDIISRLLGEPRDVPSIRSPFSFPSNFPPFFSTSFLSLSLALSLALFLLEQTESTR